MTGPRIISLCACFSATAFALRTRKTALKAFIALLAVLVVGLAGSLSAQSLPQSGSWRPTAAMSQARTGAAAAAMSNGNVLVTGGVDASGAVSATVEIYGASGTFAEVAPMNIARTGHTATWLASGANGYVLVTGGTTGGGVIAGSAELYDPASNSWTLLSAPASSGAAATPLPAGALLLSGGIGSSGVLSDLQRFDLTSQQFSFAGALPLARKSHAAAALQDGRVLIAGGIDASGNTLNSIEIYDPVAGVISPGPAMYTPRANATATTLLDGKVLIAGGSYAEGAAANGNIAELNSAEVYDPATGNIAPAANAFAQARAGHQAFLLPNNNNVLLVGGTYNGADLASSELYTPWVGTFAATGAMSTARSSAAGAPLFPMADGQLLIAGGSNQSSAELYAFPTVTTDKSDYAPGESVVITGRGWQPGESVTLSMKATPDSADVMNTMSWTAADDGTILDGMWAPDVTDIGASFYLTAVGAGSGLQARNTFTDGNPTTTLTVNGSGGNVTLNGNQTIKSCTGTCGSFTPNTSKSISCTASCTVTWNGNYNVSVVENTPTTGFEFTGWSGACTGLGSCNISAAGNTNVALGANFAPFTITSVSPSSGPTTGGTIVTIAGTNLSGTNLVKFGNNVATSFTVNSNTQVTATSPAGTAGTVDVSLQVNGSNSSTTTADQFTYGVAPAITSANNWTAGVGTAVSFTVRATGTPAPTFSVTAGTLPSGVTLSSAGVLSGSSTSAGAFPVTITASNGISPAATQTFTLTLSQAPTFTSADHATFTVGTAGSFTVTATGGYPTSITYQAYSGPGTGIPATLPSGVTFSSTGVLSGTPAPGTSGSYPIWIVANNGLAGSGQSFTLTVNQVPAFTSAASAMFWVGSNGSFTVTASGSPAPTFSVAPNTLPSGVTLSAGGVLSGTPAPGAGGVYTFTITASNGVNPNATQNFTLTVYQAPAITSAASATFTVGSNGSFAVTASGSPASSFIVTGGTLPSGITLSLAGVLSGTPTAAGSFPITILASNGVDPNATQSFTLTVNQAPAFTSAASTTFTVGSNGSFAVTASGSPAPAFSVTNGSLPSGVTLSSTGALSGTPTAAGSFPITITASNGVNPNATQSFTLTVNQVPAFTSAASATFTVGSNGSFTVTASGSPASVFIVHGTLPSGVTLSSAGVLSGTPTAAGSFPFVISAINNAGTTDQSFTLTVNQAPTITSADNWTTGVGMAVSFTVTASGTPAPTFSVTAGTLPSGVTLSSAGVLSGSSTSAGAFPVTITASNGTLPNATQTFTLTLSQGPTFTSADHTTFTVGAAGSFTFTASGGYPPVVVNYNESGTLPSGVTFSTTGVLSGTPAAGTAGSYPITIGANNGLNGSSQSFMLTVGQPTPSVAFQGVIDTVAGNGSWGYSGDNGPANGAQLYGTFGTAVDSAGNLYLAEIYNHRVRKVDAATGLIITIAGDGIAGYNGDNIAATSARLNVPYSVAVDLFGNVYIADSQNHRIRKIIAATGMITTVAGTGTAGFIGDNGPATSAQLNNPRGVAVDADGNFFIADGGNNRIRRVDVGSGLITTVAGKGWPGYGGDNGPATDAQVQNPWSVALDSAGNIYIADDTNRIRKVDAATHVITTVAGNGTAGYNGDGIPATSAQVNQPQGIALDSSGNLYIADSQNHRIRKVTAAGITTVAGTGTDGYNGDKIWAIGAQLNNPHGVAVDGSGNLYISDLWNYRLRKVQGSGLSFGSVRVGSTSVAQSITVFNTGDAALTFNSIGVSTHFNVNNQTTTCSTSSPLPVGASCTVGVVFTPMATGSLSGTLTLTDNALITDGGIQQIQLLGTGLVAGPVDQAPLTVTGMPNSTQPYQATFTVGSSGGSGTGLVTFTGSGACSASGTTIHMDSGTGTCSVTATKAADSNYNSTTSAASIVTASLASQAALSVTGVPATAQQFGATFPVGSSGGNGTGAVTYNATGACSNNGNLVTMIGGTGICSVTATKAADANYSSTSAAAVTVSASLAAQTQLSVTGMPTSAQQQGATFTVGSSGGSGTGGVSYSATGACSNNGTTVTMISSTGNCQVTVIKAADSNYQGATGSASVAAATLPAGIDLAETITSSPATANAGGVVQVNDTVSNSHGTNAGYSYTFYYLVSGTGAKTLLKSSYVPGVTAGSAYAETASLTIPVNLTGPYTLQVCADGYNSVLETDETNNCASAAITIAGPDLKEDPTALKATDASGGTSFVAGGAINITDKVQNIGSGNAGSTTTALYLSMNPGGKDIYLGSRSAPALSGTGNTGTTSDTATKSLTIPVNLNGGYYVTACADYYKTLTEDTSNNCASLSTTINIAGADLTEVQASLQVTGGTGGLYSGGPITVNDKVLNQGAGSAGTTSTSFYLNTTSDPNAKGTLLGRHTVSGISGGGSNYVSSATPLTLPVNLSGSTTYYVAACADSYNVVAEPVGGNTNNCASVAFTVAPADLKEDSVSVPAGTLYAGGNVTVTDTLKNIGAGNAGATTTFYYLSVLGQPNTKGAYLGSRTAPALGGTNTTAQPDTENKTLTLPVSVHGGPYAVIACADYYNSVPEADDPNDTNNCLASNTFSITGADLVEAATLSTASTTWTGGKIQVSETVTNQTANAGGGAGASTTFYYLSLNTNDRGTSIGSRSVGALTAGASSPFSGLLTLPNVSPGLYHFVACADGNNQVAETDENNCVWTQNVVQIQ